MFILDLYLGRMAITLLKAMSGFDSLSQGVANAISPYFKPRTIHGSDIIIKVFESSSDSQALASLELIFGKNDDHNVIHNSLKGQPFDPAASLLPVFAEVIAYAVTPNYPKIATEIRVSVKLVGPNNSVFEERLYQTRANLGKDTSPPANEKT